MSFLPLLHIISLLCYGCLATYLLFKNSRSWLNRSCALVLICFMIWCLGKSIIHHPGVPYELAGFFRNLVIVGAWTFSSFLLIFVLMVAEQWRLLSRWTTYLALFGIPLISIGLQWYDGRLLFYVPRDFGWGLAWRPGVWSVLLLAHVFVVSILAAVWPLHYSFKAVDRAKRQQARIVGLSILTGITLGFVTNLVAPWVGLDLPDLAQNLGLIWTAGIVYAVVKYDFLVINPATAAGAIFDAMTETLILADPHGRAVMVNPAGKALIGDPSTDQRPRSIHDLFIVREEGGTRKVADLSELTLPERTLEMICRNGQQIPVSVSLARLDGSNGDPAGMAIIARDITRRMESRRQLQQAKELLEQRVEERTWALQQTNRKLQKEIEERLRAQTALAESESKFKLISEQSLLGVVMFQDNVVKYANAAWAQITGFSVEEMLSWRPREFARQIHPEDRDGLIAQARRSRSEEGDAVIRQEWRLLTKSGQTRWIAMHARTVHFERRPAYLATLIDVTESKNDLLALEESEEKYRLLVENANDAILIIQNNRIHFPNQRTLALTGRSEAELAAMDLEAVIYPEDREQVQMLLAARLRGKPVEGNNRTFRIVDRIGRIIWVQASAVNITWENEPAVLSIVRDISAQKQIEAQLAHKDRLEAIGTLAGGISHDFNNLLSPLVGFSEFLLEQVPRNSEMREAVEQIRLATLRSRDLVRQILTFSRQQESVAVPVDFVRVLQDTLRLSRSTIPDTIELEVDVHPEAAWVDGDTTQLHQVILNLIINACHAMGGEKGMLTIRLLLVGDHDPCRQKLELDSGDYLCLRISDTGCGMDAETLGRIFDPYYTTKDIGQGTGLGLSVVAGIIEGCGGQIDVHSTQGQGTRFEIYLPCVTPVAEEAQPEEPAAPSIMDGVRVLLVDDEETVLTVTCHMLERLGCQVTTAADAGQALERFDESAGAFDLVLTDMSMPKVSGEELGLQIKARKPDLPVILATGYSEQVLNGQINPEAIDAHLVKPFEFKVLEKTLQTVLAPPS